jgi:parvulin-like peptidyl-prolyl isomerase
MVKKLLTTLASAILIAGGLLTLTACEKSAAGSANATASAGTSEPAAQQSGGAIETSAQQGEGAVEPAAKQSDGATEPAVKQGNGVIEPADIIARVGDQPITFSELNTALNSSAMVGLSIPALGTPQRSKVILTLLDKMISADLIYLDAKEKGTDKEKEYLTDMKKFEEAILIDMYRSRVLIGKIPVTEDAVNDFYKKNISPTNELNDDLKLAIEAKIRSGKYDKLKDSLRDRLRADTKISINETVLSTSYDSERKPTDVLATIGDQGITWSDVATEMRGADFRASLAEFYVDDNKERLKRLNNYIDNRLMVEKARAAGMDKDPEFVQRTAEFRKTRLINIHREQLVKSWQPSDDQLRTYFMDNIEHLEVPESRKVQMVVVATKKEAEDIKQRIDKGEITMFQAAQQYSLDPNAKATLGELGWVKHGTGFPGLDDFTFKLEPDVVGGPVQSPAGWHLVKVLDVLDAQYDNIDDPETRQLTLHRYMQEKFNAYVVDLRKNHFKVAVYQDELTRNFQKEANMVAELQKKAQEKGSVTEQRQKDLQKWIEPTPQQIIK